MEALNSPITSFKSTISIFPKNHQFHQINQIHRSVKRITASQSRSEAEADNNGRNYGGGGKLVDESMIVLRKRIHEMKMAERDNEPPANWMEWEKRCFPNYDSDICEALGYLQSHLMNTRPAVALGIVTMISLSLPVTSAVVLFRLVEIVAGVLAGVHPFS